jgi:predicted dehydrogenase
MTDHRVAIAATGGAAGTHARAYENLPDATVVACAGRSREGVESFAEAHDCAGYLDVGEMLDAESVDVLSVCTPAGAHLEPTAAAAERGVDVLCEKPLEITTERIDEMLTVADEGGIRLGGIFQRRYRPLLQAMRDAVAAGRFGSLAVAGVGLPWWRDDDYYAGRWQGDPELAGGGVAINQAIHSIDAVQWLVGCGMDLEPGENPVSEVFAYTDCSRDEDVTTVEDSAVANLRFRDGTVAQLLGSTAMYPGGEMRYELGGPDGSALVQGDDLVSWQFREEEAGDDEIRELFGPDGAGGDAPDPLETANAREFLDAREFGEPFMLEGREARKAVAIVEAIYESADSGEPVSPS